jgi:predicted sulfurtransferase
VEAAWQGTIALIDKRMSIRHSLRNRDVDPANRNGDHGQNVEKFTFTAQGNQKTWERETISGTVTQQKNVESTLIAKRRRDSRRAYVRAHNFRIGLTMMAWI